MPAIATALALAPPEDAVVSDRLRHLQAAAQASGKLPPAPDFHETDEVEILGARHGFTLGRWKGGPADTLSIEFDLSGAGPLMRDDPEFGAMLERSGKAWSYRIADTWSPWERRPGDLKGYLINGHDPDIPVYVEPGGEVSTGLEIDVRDAAISPNGGWANNFGIMPPGSSYEPRFGSIEIDRQHLRESDDAYLFRTLTHEIGHVLGAWLASDHSFTELSSDERFAQYIDAEAGTWTGPNVVAIHGRPAPFQDSVDPYGWVDGERSPLTSEYEFNHSGVCSSIMAYCSTEEASLSLLPHAIDFAFLADLGITIVEETDRAESYGLAGWGEYAGFSVSVSRKLQTELADPQPGYDVGAAPWQTLDVIDQLRVGVDAFGYRSAGKFLDIQPPTIATAGTVYYVGALLGAAIDRPALPPVTGNARLAMDLDARDGSASFTSLTVHEEGGRESFSGGALHYPLALTGNAIVGTDAAATLSAHFYGPWREEVAGTLHDPSAGLLAGFGASTDDRPSREEVIASADWLAGLSVARSAPDPDDNGWFWYRCGAAQSCEILDDEIQDDGTGIWKDWAPATREAVLSATAGRGVLDEATLVEDRGAVRVERQSAAEIDGARGRHVVDGYTGVLEYGAFGIGFERYSDTWSDPNDARPGFFDVWTGAQGAMAGRLPEGHAHWSGPMLGFQWRYYDAYEMPFVEGVASVDYDLSTNLMDIEFSDVASRDGARRLPDFRFDGGNIRLDTDGTFEGFGNNDILNGTFVGPDHEEVVGMFNHAEAGVIGSFGARPMAEMVTPGETAELRLPFGAMEARLQQSNDGQSIDRVVEYLRVHASGGPWQAGPDYNWSHPPGLVRFTSPPVVRMAEGTSERYRAITAYAVALINRALPYDLHLTFGADAPAGAAGQWQEGLPNVPDGQIFVEFIDASTQGGRPGAEALGHNDTQHEYDTAQGRLEKKHLRAGAVEMDNRAFAGRPDYQVASVLVHEMIHVLGLHGHVDAPAFRDSNMYDAWFRLDGSLPAIDAAALQALYMKLGEATEPEEMTPSILGAWSRESANIDGAIGEVSFGVRHNNGVSMPWTFGGEPSSALRDSRTLSGTVTWAGGLLGFTPALDVVGGNASLSVNLGTMGGRVNFTDLQSWTTDTTPGALGSGSPWNSGSLGYTIVVGGNYLRSTGGAEGTVNGHFYGTHHAGVAGSLERGDLTAAFGAIRN